MVTSGWNCSTISAACGRALVTVTVVAEIYVHTMIIAPVIFGSGRSYVIYLCIYSFICANIIGNLIGFVCTDTSINVDTCKEAELDVMVCVRCERNVPPRCVHCECCNACTPRRRCHSTLLGNCVGYFNHRYWFCFAVHTLIYSANAVLLSVMMYQCVHKNCSSKPTSIDNYPDEDFCTLIAFFASAFLNFFWFIFDVTLLTEETELIFTGRLKRESRQTLYNYDKGFTRNMACIFGERYYLVWICPAIKSELPDMHSVLYPVGQRPPYSVRY